VHDKRRKICIVVPNHWSSKMGGSQYQAGRLVTALTKDPGNQVFFLSRSVDPDYRPGDYSVVSVASKFSLPRYRRVFDIPEILKQLRRIRPEVVYQRVGCAYTAAAAYYARHTGCHMVWHVASDIDVLPYRQSRDYGAEEFWFEKKLLEYGIRRSDLIVAQTRTQARLLAEHYGREATAIIPNFHPPATESVDKSGDLKVVWIANIKSLKMPEVFLRLASDLSNMTGVRFIMVGKQSTDAGWLQTFATMTAGLNNLDFLGEQTQDQVNRLLAESHLLVNTSRFEGFSNTFVQAWLRNVPVASLHVNPDGVFDDRRLGVHTGDYEALRNNVRMLLEQPLKLEQMGKEAYRYAVENHSERNLDKLIEILVDTSALKRNQ